MNFFNVNILLCDGYIYIPSPKDALTRTHHWNTQTNLCWCLWHNRYLTILSEIFPSQKAGCFTFWNTWLLCWACLPRQAYCSLRNFGFILECSSLRDFGPYVIGQFSYEDFGPMIFWLVLKLDISYRVIISWRILVSFRGFFWRLYFCMVKYLSFHKSSFVLRYFLI